MFWRWLTISVFNLFKTVDADLLSCASQILDTLEGDVQESDPDISDIEDSLTNFF